MVRGCSCRRGSVERMMRIEIGVSGRHESRWLDHQIRGSSAFVTLASSEEAAIVKHVLACRVQRPVVAFAWISRLSWDLNKAVVE